MSGQAYPDVLRVGSFERVTESVGGAVADATEWRHRWAGGRRDRRRRVATAIQVASTTQSRAHQESPDRWLWMLLRHWYVALDAEGAVLTGDLDVEQTVRHASEHVASNPICSAVVDRAHAILLSAMTAAARPGVDGPQRSQLSTTTNARARRRSRRTRRPNRTRRPGIRTNDPLRHVATS